MLKKIENKRLLENKTSLCSGTSSLLPPFSATEGLDAPFHNDKYEKYIRLVVVYISHVTSISKNETEHESVKSATTSTEPQSCAAIKF